MADGLNDARCMRIAEVIEHFGAIHTRIAQYNVNPPPGQAQASCYVVLRQCRIDAQALLAMPFPALPPGAANNTTEQTKQQLRGILLDASARRFRAYKIFLKAAAAMRCIQRRNQILQGQTPTAAHTAALAQAATTLIGELTNVTDQQVYSQLHARDVQAGNWTAQMPSLQNIRTYIQQS